MKTICADICYRGMDGRKRGSARLKTVKSETRMRDKDTWVGDSKADLIGNIKTGSGRQCQCKLTGWLASMTALEKACSISEKSSLTILYSLPQVDIW